MAQLEKAPVPGFEWHEGEPFEAMLKRHEAAFAKLQKVAEALPAGEVVGAIVQFPVADNYARYLVTSAKPLKLRHIPYMDGYAINAAHLRDLRLADIERQVAQERATRELFAKWRTRSPAA